jgi:PAS domain S-box-containing protein
LQAGVMTLLLGAYAGLAVSAETAAAGPWYTHLAYPPIVLAGLWWGRRGLIVPALLAVASVLPQFMGAAPSDLAANLVRLAAYLAVGVSAGLAGEMLGRARGAVRMSEAKYRQLAEKTLAGIFVYRDDVILYVNTRLQEMLGYSLADAAGRSYWDFVSPQDRPRVRELAARRENQGVADLRYECRLVTRAGDTVWADIISSQVDYEGRPAVLVCVYDITDRKETEEKRRELSTLAEKQEEQLVHSTRLAEMGEMAAGIAHEINQPLTGIRNFARNASFMLEAGVGGKEELRENLRMIATQVDRASRIIHQMRELARRTERHVSLVDVNNTLRESVEFVMPQLRLSGVEVVFDLAPNLPRVLADRIRLEQVFLNLLTNARHAMEESQRRILSVRTRHDPVAPLPVAIEVADTGTGFSPDIAEKLFAPFFSTKKAGRGTGLGLSISLGIIKDHKGVIEAAGTEGHGATFTIRLPVGQEEQTEGQQQA